MPVSRKPGCTYCRDKHLRCDRARPACSNCRAAKPPVNCVFGGIKIRQSSYSTRYPSSWSESRPSDAIACLTHSDSQERATLRGSHGDIQSDSLVAQSPSAAFAHESAECDNTRGLEGAKVAWHVQERSPSSVQRIETISPRTIPGGFEISENSYVVRSPTIERPGQCVTSPRSDLHGRTHSSVHRSITNRLESRVFDFYISHAGPWLDIVSSHRHFGQTIPRLALREPVLYYACLAYASYVLYLRGELDEYIQEQFQNKAIGLLIPHLSPHLTPASDRALLATTVILRMSEQFSEIADDAQHHLNGAYSLFAIHGTKWSPVDTDMRGVAFWIYLRESIRVSFLNEQPCQFDLDMVDCEQFIPESAPEEAWANQMTYLLARLCNVCWSDCDDHTKSQMRAKIQRCLDDWKAQLPEAFQPWFFCRKDYEPFWTMKFISPWHIIAWQQYYTAKVMLAVHASSPRCGHNVLLFNQYLETEVVTPARLACSICFSSQDIGCNVNGTHLISWCGQFFTGKEEQRLLAKFLKEFMEDTKWPNKTCFERLEQIWNGTRQTWSDG